ncbi:MAG: energy transducer TonB [Rhizobacter sp.]
MAVALLHLLLAVVLIQYFNQHNLPVAPPAVVGMLVTAPPVVEPVPLPAVAQPQPQPPPRPVVRRQPVPPAPVAAPSERAVTAAPPVPAPPAVAEAAAVEALPSPAPPAPAPVAVPAPVVPPRSDAAHLNNPAPAYPPVSRRLGEQGRVQLDVYILADGSVGDIKLKRSSGYPRLDQAALEAVRQWRYQPARRGSEAIPFWYVQPLTFSLEG